MEMNGKTRTGSANLGGQMTMRAGMLGRGMTNALDLYGMRGVARLKREAGMFEQPTVSIVDVVPVVRVDRRRFGECLQPDARIRCICSSTLASHRGSEASAWLDV